MDSGAPGGYPAPASGYAYPAAAPPPAQGGYQFVTPGGYPPQPGPGAQGHPGAAPPAAYGARIVHSFELIHSDCHEAPGTKLRDARNG